MKLIVSSGGVEFGQVSGPQIDIMPFPPLKATLSSKLLTCFKPVWHSP